MADDVDAHRSAEILVVDDTIANLRLLASMLTSQGYRVLEAVDGPQALEAIRISPPDLVLLDIRMPGMDGYEVCRRIKADEATANIPVIFVSALDEQNDKIQGFAAGGIDYITKPFHLREVLARVDTHITLRKLQRRLEQQNIQLQQEVVERLRAEQALQAVNEELERRVQERAAEAHHQAQQVIQIMNTVPEGLLLVQEDGSLIRANLTAQRILQTLGAAQNGDAAVIHRLGDTPLANLLLPPEHNLFHEIVHGALMLEVAARPVEDDGKPARWVMLIRDVTNQREMQRRLAQQDRLAAVGQMAAGIAHDFNNILAVILLYTEMALNTPNLPSRLAERLKIIASQSQRASELILQILDFSRRSALEQHPMDLGPFIKEQVKLLGRTLPENIRLGLKVAPGDLELEADPTRMQQMIMNLAANARDAMPDGGKMTIGVSRLPPNTPIACIGCGLVTEGEWLCLEVRDTGMGIAAGDLPHIFEPFFSTKEPGKGTGLGLAQVYGIVKSHKGHVSVTSTPGEGTVFQLYLPVRAVAAPAQGETRPERLVHGKGQTILLVEDEDTARQALTEGLTLINYQVAPASNGKEALEVLHRRGGQVDLVLSDVVMPEMGGPMLLNQIRQAGWRTPVIFMTGHPLPISDLPDSDKPLIWLQKPPRLKQLANILAQALH